MKCTNCSFNNLKELETIIIKGKNYYLCNRCDDYFLPRIEKNRISKKANFKFFTSLFFNLLKVLAFIYIYIHLDFLEIIGEKIFERMFEIFPIEVLIIILIIIFLKVVLSRIINIVSYHLK